MFLGEDIFGVVCGTGDEIAIIVEPCLDFSVAEGVGHGAIGVIVGTR